VHQFYVLFQHESICEFPSKEFYDKKLKTDSSVSLQFCSLEKFWPNNNKNCPIVFCDLEGKEEDYPKGYQESKSNRIEAEKVVSNYTLTNVLHNIVIPYRWRLSRHSK